MTKYTAKDLEETFKSAASLRIARKEKGNQDYASDAGYWTGGQCEWGGSHNLKEDCETIEKGLGNLNELKNTKEELQKCTSEQEFKATKSRLIRQTEELERKLQVKTSSSSSMFSICIIWADFNEFIESKLKTIRSEVNRLKGDINNQEYKYYEEIKLLKLEQRKIESRMKENKRKAQTEKDPAQKALLLQMIEDDGKILEENLKKQKVIPVVNLKFEPDKYVSDLIKAMKDAIEKDGKKDKPTGTNKKNKKPTNSNNNSDDENTDAKNDNGTNNQPKKEDKPNFFQENKQLIIFASIACLALLYFYSQKPEETNNYDYY